MIGSNLRGYALGIAIVIAALVLAMAGGAGALSIRAVEVEHRESYQRRLATNAQASGAGIRFT